MMLHRPVEAMPDIVAGARDRQEPHGACAARPDNRRNDYLGWIDRAKRQETMERRVGKMLDERAAGEGDVTMPWRPRG